MFVLEHDYQLLVCLRRSFALEKWRKRHIIRDYKDKRKRERELKGNKNLINMPQ